MGCVRIFTFNLARPRRASIDALIRLTVLMVTTSRRFPVVSGFRVSWDSRRPPGHRVLGVWLIQERELSDVGSEHTSGTSTPRLMDAEPIERNEDGPRYKIVTREYLAEGHDGFIAFKGKPFLIDHEDGHLMSGIVRKYLMGSHFVNKMATLVEHPSSADFRSNTQVAISREQARRRVWKRRAESEILKRWKRVANIARRLARSRLHYQDQLNVSTTEDMSSIDAYDGENIRKGRESVERRHVVEDDDLLVVSPEIDGRLKDEGRSHVIN